jgi:hypothetical protein
MRFRADGPSIPVELLEQRDRGNVVFFCGAGVSKPAGLPSFPELAKRVMTALGTSDESTSRALLDQGDGAQNLDRVFNLLYQEYRRDEVDEAVNRILRTPRSANTAAHATILRLSRSAAGQPQVVTTNFDRLFERVDGSLQFHVGPALPDIRSVGSFEGLVYLHGRTWTPGGSSRGRGKELILSSADFGRAYLADGWATRFVRELLESYFIVLVGYSASDPPVRYLLEGLQSRRGSEASTIYAFDQGDFDAVVDRWRSLGVQALPYPAPPDRQHAALWNTLSAWAARADDPDEWRRSIVALAQRSPSQLEPFQRGQVAAVVRTSEGAADFANANPPPSAEWLCVLDRSIRYAQPQRGFGRDGPDPLSIYGLDDDPARSESDAEMGGTDHAPAGIDLIAVTVGDERKDRNKRLAGVWRQHSDRLPDRLMHLANWYGRVADQPTALWWAAGYEALHPQLVAAVEWHQRHANAFSELGRRAWHLLLERFHHAPDRRDLDAWYPFVWRLEREGWTGSTLRDFERAVTPYVAARRPSRRWGPPTADEGEGSLGTWIDFEVVFPGHDRDKLEIPTEWLPGVFEIVRRGLHRSATLLAETARKYWRTASFVPDEDPGDRYLNDASKYLHWVRELFDRLSTEHPDVARDELGRWPVGEPYFFAKLAIYAWGLAGLTDGRTAAHGMLGMPDDQFWDDGHRRELLQTLRARWNDFEPEVRRRLENRIVTGRLRWEGEDEEEHRSRVRQTAAVILAWLDKRGCHLSPAGQEELRQSKASIPEWRDSWADAADQSLDGRGGFVATQPDPAVLLDAPLSDLAETAEKHTSEDWRTLTRREPFQGLVQQHPRRAVAALTLELRRNRHHPALWRDLLSHWPSSASDRLLCVCAGRLITMPDTLLAELQHEPTRWFRTNAKRIAARSPELSYRLFDRILGVISSRGADATVSAIGDVSVGGRVLQRSRRTIEHAINSSIGHLTGGLLEVLSGLALGQGSGLPPAVSARLETLLQAPGEGRDHAVCLTTQQLRWLYSLDPGWTRKRLISLFTIGHDLCEPAWNGLLQDNRVPGPQLFSLMKPHFLGIFESIARWQWDEHPRNRLVEFLVVACLWGRKNKAYVSFGEARTALRAVDDRIRSHALWFLAQLVETPGTWVRFARLFLQRAWPRESRYQTPGVARQLGFLAERSGDDFPDVVRTILPLVVPTDQLDVTLHRATEEGENSLATRFPESMLQLLDRLVPDDPRPTPYGLGSVLDSIATASLALRSDGRWRRLRRIAERG